MSEFTDYMAAFEVATLHNNTCQTCQNNQPCAVGDPIHADFLTKKATYEASQ